MHPMLDGRPTRSILSNGIDRATTTSTSGSGTFSSPRLELEEPVDSPQGTERIVLAEDDTRARKSMQLILEDMGYLVDAYASGPEVLAALAKNDLRVDLLLTDFDMPGLTGYELARRLRALRPDARVLLTSGSSEENIVPSAKPADWPPFISKPFTYVTLSRKLREVLDDPQGHTVPDTPADLFAAE